MSYHLKNWEKVIQGNVQIPIFVWHKITDSSKGQTKSRTSEIAASILQLSNKLDESVINIRLIGPTWLQEES